MNISKKSVILSVVMTALSMVSASVLAGCQTCAEKMAIRKSIKEAMAAQLAASKPASKHLDSIEHTEDEACCESCAAGNSCEGKRCPCGINQKDCAKDWIQAEGSDTCMLLKKIQCMMDSLAAQSAWCCKKLNHKIKEQGEDARKCCKHIRHELNEIEDLIISQTDQPADCCSVIESRIGDPCDSSVVDIPYSASIVEEVDASCLDILTWLKSIYVLVAQIFTCTCQI